MKPDKTMGDKKPNTRFPIVGIGASAGGLHSLECFLEALPKDFDFAVVFIQHLSPAHKSLMPEVLRSKWRDHEFIEIEDGLHLLPGRLYLCTPAIEIRIHEGAFRVIARPDEHIHFPIDEFLVSLAEDSAELAVAVIFSGAGTDGIRGIQAVRTEGGTVFVQDPVTAQFPELPQAAIKTGQVDGVLSPPDIAREIIKLLGSGAVTEAPDKLINSAELEPFYLLIREKTGHRFNHYKKSVISRRIRRRMYLQGISSVTEYLNVVADKPGEAALLASDLMIGVTSFFRDRLAWKALRLEVIRKLVIEDGDAPIRVWTPACATGEESYSIAMMLRLELDLAGSKRELQVFATDVNDGSLAKAREGKYPASIAADVPTDYLRKFFTYTDDDLAVSVSKELRQHVIFAKQDILTDPPFSRLDLIICRNLLIYLEADAQEKCITLFHYALRPGGYLFLGNAESPGRQSTLFKSLTHKKCRVYEKVETEPPSRLSLTVPFAAERAAVPIKQQPALDHQHSVIRLSQEILLEEYGPAAVTIDQNYDILYNNGPTKRYLTQPRGALTQNLLELIPENLRNRIRGAIYKVTREARPVSIRAGITVEEGEKRQVSIRVSKIKDDLFLVVFREKAGPPSEASSESLETVCVEEPVVRQLEVELSATRQELQTNIEQLKSLNEEQQSSNEELQAANEELETSREELQSLNEELITVNTQLQSKVEEQEETNNDLNNFLGSTNIPTVFLDDRFRVKRYTPAITKLIKLIPSDVGRQIIDMSQEALGPDLIADAQSVLENLVPVKKEILIDGGWYVRTILPYRTYDNRIEGVVVTYNDVTELKRAEECSRNLASFPQLNPNPIIEIDSSGKVTFCNQGALKTLESSGMDKGDIEVFLPPDLGTILGGWDKRNEMTLHREIIIKDRVFVETIHLVPQFDVARIYAVDITERKRAEEEIQTLLTAVQQEKTKLSSLINSISDEVWFADTQGRFTIANPSALREFGISSGDIIEVEKFTRNLEVFRPDGSPRPVEEAPPLRGLLGEEIRNQEEIVRTPATGDLQYREVSTTPVRDNTGEIIGSVSVVRNVTDRKRAEEALRQSEERYRTLFNTMMEGFCIIEVIFDSDSRPVDYRFLEINAAFEVQTGLQNAQGRLMRELAPDHEAQWFEIYGKIALTGEPARFVNEARALNRWYNVSAYRVGGPENRQVAILFNDITGHKLAEEALQASEQLLRLFIEYAPASLAMFDREMRYLSVSRRWLSDYNLEGREFRGLSHYEVFPEISDRWKAIHRRALAGEVIRDDNDRFDRADGSVQWLRWEVRPWYDVTGDVAGIVIFSEDVTERKKAEDALRESEERFRSVLDNSTDCIYRFNLQTGCYEYISPSAEKIVGFSPEELIAQDVETALSMIHPADMPAMRAALARLEETGELESEYRQRTKSGDYRWISNRMSLTRDSADRPLYRDGNIRDITERKEAEEVQGRLAAIVESAEDAIIGEDLSGIIQTWNVGAENIFGYKAEEVIGKPISLLVPPRHADEVPEIFARVKQGEHIENFETVRMRKDGTIIPVSLTFSAVKDISGRIIGASRIAHDITERKRAEETLRRSEKQYRELFENMIEGFAYCKMVFENGKPQDFIYLLVNHAFETLTGLKNVIGKRVTEIIPGIREADPELFEIYSRVSETGKPERFEMFVKALKMWFSISVYSPEKECFVAVFDVITERKRAEEALRQSERREHERAEELAALFEAVPTPVFIARDPDCLHLTGNRLAGEILRIPQGDELSLSGPEETRPRHFRTLKDGRELRLDELPAQRAAHGAHVKDFEFTLAFDDGMVRHVLGYGTPLLDDQGRPRGTVAVLVDITKLKQAEEALKLSNAELAAVNRELESFIYSVSHDLRGPLRAISGFSEIMMKDIADKLNDKGKRYLSRILDGTEKMSRLIDDLLNLSRMSRQEIQRKSIDLSEMASSIIADLREANPGRSTDADIKGGLTAFADPGLIEIVLSNLLGNSWKFTSKTEHARIEFGTVEQDGKIVYYVRDNGVGFDQKYAEKMFWPFHRLHSESAFEGTGIGLAIVDRIIRRHGGNVWAVGIKGKGATIYFSLT